MQQQKQKDRSAAAAATAPVVLPDLVRPEGLCDADWSLVKAVAEEQEAILQQQQQQQQQHEGSGGDGSPQCMLGEGLDALDGPPAAAGGSGGGGGLGGLGFVVRERDGISRVCPAVEGMGQGSLVSSGEEEEVGEHPVGEGEEEGMVEGHVSWLSSVQKAAAVSTGPPHGAFLWGNGIVIVRLAEWPVPLWGLSEG
jgi:hypothetical protein